MEHSLDGGGTKRSVILDWQTREKPLTSHQILPWDDDIDVQVSEASIFYMAAYFNMSVWHFQTPRIPEGRDYLLEVNPNYKTRDAKDKYNVIDARWIDTESGLFIDITAARYNLTHPEGEGMMSCKDGHEFRVRPCRCWVFPFWRTSGKAAHKC
jgi:LicD family